MVILRCTRELLARVTRAPVEPAATSTTRLGDWYVTIVRVGPRQYLLAVSERTRLPVLVPARDARGMAETLPGAVGRVLLAIGVPEADAGAESDAMADAVFAPTRNRSLLGTINEFTFAIQHRLQRGPVLLDELAIWLADTPIHTRFHDGRPVDVTRQVVGLEQAPRRRVTLGPLAPPNIAAPPTPKRGSQPAPKRAEPLPMEFALYAEMATVQRCEYLDGAMHVSPSPSPTHQVAVLRIARALDDDFAGADREAVVLAGPVAVFLDDQTVAQPDVVVAHRRQLSARGVEGAPQLIGREVYGRPAAAPECPEGRRVRERGYARAGPVGVPSAGRGGGSGAADARTARRAGDSKQGLRVRGHAGELDLGRDDWSA